MIYGNLLQRVSQCLLAGHGVVNNGSNPLVNSFTMSAASTPLEHAKNTPPMPRWRKELLLALACLGVGLIVLPILIYVVGAQLLATYGGGSGIGAFYGDFLRNLMAGTLRTWFIVLAPYLLLRLLQLIFCLGVGNCPLTSLGQPVSLRDQRHRPQLLASGANLLSLRSTHSFVCQVANPC
jgi:hypothetical protein